jgi:type I restriction enzyme, S subunit
MSKLADLIQELCPDGLETVALGDVIEDLRTGLNPRTNFQLNTPDAQNHYVTVRELNGFGLTLTDKTDRVNDEGLKLILRRSRLKKGDVLFSGTGTIGRTSLLLDTPTNWGIKEGVYAITPVHTKINPRYLIYLLTSPSKLNRIKELADGSTVASISMASLRKLDVELPPLKIQEEIVRILDTFTDLEAELEAELEARRVQANFYKDSFLKLETSPSVQLGDVVEILDNLRKPISRDKREAGEYPYYGANGIQGYVKNYIFDGTFLLMGEDGSVINHDQSPVLHWVVGKIWVNNHAHVLKEKSESAILRYIYYALQTRNVSPIVRGMPPKINQANMRSIEIPLPPLEEQSAIVKVLDSFTELDIQISNELDSRRRQFEHYRSKLLTFKKLDAA